MSLRYLLHTMLFLPLLAFGQVVPTPTKTSPFTLSVADSLVRQGLFSQAKEVYAQVASQTESVDALVGVGRISLYENRLPDAERALAHARRLSPSNTAAASLLVEVYRRKHEPNLAIPLLRELHQDGNADAYAKLENAPYYRAEHLAEPVRIRFIQDDPLPVVEVSINGGKPTRFFIDTGAGEVLLDQEFARQNGISAFDGFNGTFAGGKQAPVKFGAIRSIGVGGARVHNLPVQIMDLSGVSASFGKPLAGCIGTRFFSLWLATLDYPHHSLVLQNKTAAVPRADISRGDTESPFWMAGDHYMVAWGRVNTAPASLLFLDSGLAGGGFTGPESSFAAANISLSGGPQSTGTGAGGAVPMTRVVIDSLSLGTAEAKAVSAVYMGPFPLENLFAFRIGGIISQDFFKGYAVTFDFVKMRVVLARA